MAHVRAGKGQDRGLRALVAGLMGGVLLLVGVLAGQAPAAAVSLSVSPQYVLWGNKATWTVSEGTGYIGFCVDRGKPGSAYGFFVPLDGGTQKSRDASQFGIEPDSGEHSVDAGWFAASFKIDEASTTQACTETPSDYFSRVWFATSTAPTIDSLPTTVAWGTPSVFSTANADGLSAAIFVDDVNTGTVVIAGTPWSRTAQDWGLTPNTGGHTVSVALFSSANAAAAATSPSQGLDFASTLYYTTVDVPPTNATPVATADSFEVVAGQTLTVDAPGVLGNDTDADGDALTASVVSGPASGTLALAADGSFTYAAEPSASGQVTFTYAASDGEASSTSATVTIESP